MLQLDGSQKFGTVLCAFIGYISGQIEMVIINTAIGAFVGFVVTTTLKYLWEWIKKKYRERKERSAGKGS